MEPASEHLHPLDAEALAARISDATQAGTVLLLATGMYSPDPERSLRLGVLELSEKRPRAVADAWLATAELDALAERLAGRGPVRRGAWDVMYATGWRYAWTADEQPFLLFDARGPVARLEGETLHLRPKHDKRRAVPVERVERVEGFLAEGWVRRGVRLHLDDDTALLLAVAEEMMALADPTYDAIDVLCDAHWVRSLATALGQGLGVAVALDEAL